jgi:hypothetical protein
MKTYWVVVVHVYGVGSSEVAPSPDNRKTAREIAAKYRAQGHGAYVVPRHELEAARRQFATPTRRPR